MPCKSIRFLSMVIEKARPLHNLPKIVRAKYWDSVEVFERFQGVRVLMRR